jgi:hypothetical protein
LSAKAKQHSASLKFYLTQVGSSFASKFRKPQNCLFVQKKKEEEEEEGKIRA